MNSSSINIQHLYWRAGFGPPLNLKPNISLDNEIASIFKNSNKIVPLTLTGWNPVPYLKAKDFTDAEKKAYRTMEREARLQIVNQIYERQIHADFFLREKLTLFWMGHFACRVSNPKFMLKYYNTISENALGKFSDLLRAMIRNAALLQYLNNNSNRKANPNENFARELMELFALGIGNYTENDVKEGARALTGWAFDPDGNLLIRQEHHDTGNKTFLGNTGNFDGDDIVNNILAKKECALFITTKIYKYFVNYVPDKIILSGLANDFFNSGYDVEKLLKQIFSSDWFYKKENIGSRIKSPIELINGMVRLFNISFINPAARLPIQSVLGQTLFDPPNVAGWPDGRGWIDSSTLMYRTRLPEVLLEDAETLTAPKAEFDAQESMLNETITTAKAKRIQTTYDKVDFLKFFNPFQEQKSIDIMSKFMLQVKPDAGAIHLIENFTSKSAGDTRILKTAIYLMSLPEYQLC